MEKLDRLGWADGISFVSHGARVGIRVNDPAVLERVPACLPATWKEAKRADVDYLYSLIVPPAARGASLRRYHLLYANAQRVARTLDPDELFDTLEKTLDFTVAMNARQRLFVHAGVVGWNGRAVLIPGPSTSGKTTLVRALIEAGATYLSDDWAPLTRAHRVYPCPKPLSLRGAPGCPSGKFAAERFGSRIGTRPLPVALVLHTRYRAGATWQPQPLPPGRALLSLLEHTVMARYRTEFALEVLQSVVTHSTAFESPRGEARDVVPWVLARLERTPVP